MISFKSKAKISGKGNRKSTYNPLRIRGCEKACQKGFAVIFTERKDITEHRNISENYIINNRKKSHGIKLPVNAQVFNHSFTCGNLIRRPIDVFQFLDLIFLTHLN